MDIEPPDPVTPEQETEATNVVPFRSYLARPRSLSRILRARRTLRPVDSQSLISAPELRPRAYVIDDNNGVTETAGLPAVIPTPLNADRKEQILRWVIARASEPSSWRGLFLLAGAIGFTISEEQSESLIALALALSGAIGMFFPDRKGLE